MHPGLLHIKCRRIADSLLEGTSHLCLRSWFVKMKNKSNNSGGIAQTSNEPDVEG